MEIGISIVMKIIARRSDIGGMDRKSVVRLIAVSRSDLLMGFDNTHTHFNPFEWIAFEWVAIRRRKRLPRAAGQSCDSLKMY